MAREKKAKVAVRNRSDARHFLTDKDGTMHEFPPNSVMEIDVSEDLRDELDERSDREGDAFELTSKAEAKKDAAKKAKLEEEAAKAQATADQKAAKAAELDAPAQVVEPPKAEHRSSRK